MTPSSQGVWHWTRRIDDQTVVHQSSVQSERAPHWCAVHGWAFDVLCTACALGLFPYRTIAMQEGASLGIKPQRQTKRRKWKDFANGSQAR